MRTAAPYPTVDPVSASNLLSNAIASRKKPLINPLRYFRCFRRIFHGREEAYGALWLCSLYMFNLHIPLGIGGFSIVANVLHQPALDPQTEALSLLVFQILELTGSLLLLRSTAKPEYEVVSFFKTDKLSEKRNWLLASLLGFGFLILLVFLTSLVADRLIGPKVALGCEQPYREGDSSEQQHLESCLHPGLLPCHPLLEEIVCRGFLLKSLASTMNWRQAIFLSSAVFSAAHFSGENFIQLFIIGCVLGCSYSCSCTRSFAVVKGSAITHFGSEG
ncbi:unnamed protein product [Dovyalis caffra]|uniref:CAAX prenyl protease 2/Lysostaphin resistance protein A-like domain-containing protein n=1 Tax=Dovyalis caffra TaxID=77055 RepID=A0AAV1SEC8_9ROSI|nr:unnamed protein product [Dovyalis caffra]